jgi:hypothetical protein
MRGRRHRHADGAPAQSTEITTERGHSGRAPPIRGRRLPSRAKAKVAIRRNVLGAVGRDKGGFDAFAGSGEMFSAVWKDAAHNTGCDQKPQRDGR